MSDTYNDQTFMPLSYTQEKLHLMARDIQWAETQYGAFPPSDSDFIQSARRQLESMLAEFDKWKVPAQGIYGS